MIETKLETHVVAIDNKENSIGMLMHGWTCSCGRKSRRITTDIRAARTGGQRHVAAMERGR